MIWLEWFHYLEWLGGRCIACLKGNKIIWINLFSGTNHLLEIIEVDHCTPAVWIEVCLCENVYFFLTAWASSRQRVFHPVWPLESGDVPGGDGTGTLSHTTASQRRNRHGDEANPSRGTPRSAKRKSICFTRTCHSNAHLWTTPDHLLKCKFENLSDLWLYWNSH